MDQAKWKQVARVCAWWILALVVLAPLETRGEAPSFCQEIEPLLSKLGCNQGACHGKGAGQNGFRLSLRGYAPEWDYDWITREFSGRRIDRLKPEDSLLIQKPLGLAAHAGGKLMREGSREHQTLINWVRAGAPGPQLEEPLVTTLAVEPTSLLLKKKGDRGLLKVWATDAQGRKRDVTWLTRFASNDINTAIVDEQGQVTANQSGETAIRASFLDQVAVVTVTFPYDRVVDASVFHDRRNLIDNHVFTKLEALRIQPSDLSGDLVFLRRVYLDAIGTLPTPDEIREFVSDQRVDKRARVIDQILNRSEWIDYWTLQLADLLQNRKERDHDVRGVKGVRQFHAWLRSQVAANRPWDALARDILLAKGGTNQQPAVGYYIVTVGEQRESERSEVVASAAQTFLGVRIGCAQCHNHPLEKYTQDDYYHFAAFFSRIKLDRKDPKQGPTLLAVSRSDPNQNKESVGAFQPRTNKRLAPQPLDRSQVSIAPGEDPRLKLVDWITKPGNPYFASAMVNRVWKHYFGKGMVEPVDDLRASNPASNRELEQALSQQFVADGYDLKKLSRLILNSRTYQLSATTRPDNQTDEKFGSHYLARRLPAEVLLDAISQATSSPEPFDGYPTGMRAIQIPDPGSNSYFLAAFGRSERVTACACERSGDVSLPQLLQIMNGESVVRKIADPEGRLAKLLKSGKSDDGMLDELFLATLSRWPEPVERTRVKEALSGADRETGWRDVFWALLNSKTFLFQR